MNMKKEVLIEELNKLGIRKDRYSLDGELVYDNVIVYKNYNK